MESLPENKLSKQMEKNIDKELERLDKLLDFCTSLGLTTLPISKDKLLENADEMPEFPFPIVKEGNRGIRIAYDRIKGVWLGFYNDFSKNISPKNEIREKIQKYWEEISQE